MQHTRITKLKPTLFYQPCEVVTMHNCSKPQLTVNMTVTYEIYLNLQTFMAMRTTPKFANVLFCTTNEFDAFRGGRQHRMVTLIQLQMHYVAVN